MTTLGYDKYTRVTRESSKILNSYSLFPISYSRYGMAHTELGINPAQSIKRHACSVENYHYYRR